MPHVTGQGFVASMAALYRVGTQGDLCGPMLSALPVNGVAISTLGDPFGSETVCASDDAAARLDEIQLDLGEGPCWEALRTSSPVMEPDVQSATSDRWPLALGAMRETRLGAVFAFPMTVGPIDVGAVDLYNEHPGSLTPSAVRDATAMAGVVARNVLHRALLRSEHDGSPGDQDGGRYSRREVHQASGMIAAQTGAGAADALLLLRAFAHTAGRPVLDLAADVIARRVDFTDHDPSDT